MIIGIIFGQVSVVAGVCWHVKHEMELCILVAMFNLHQNEINDSKTRHGME